MDATAISTYVMVNNMDVNALSNYVRVVNIDVNSNNMISKVRKRYIFII